MQDHPGAPGTARQESTHIIVSANDGGTATQPRAPGHERPHAALRAARHGRLSAASTAPGADIPPATTAGAPGQYCQSAAPRAPGHGRPLATKAGVFGHDRLSAASTATAPSPAGLRRLRQVILPRTPATPNTLTYPHAHFIVSSLRRKPQSTPSPGACSGGGLGRGRLPTHPTTHQVHPATQVPPRPRPCSPACTGFRLRHPSRAPPYPPLYMVERGPGDGPKPHHTWHYPCGFGPSGGVVSHPPSPRMSRIASKADGFSSEETSPGSSAR